MNIFAKEPIFIELLSGIKLFFPISILTVSVVLLSPNVIFFDLILTEKFKKFFNFLLKIGINYGFHHNDSHISNIIYDLEKQEIKLIDYGRSIFGKFINEESDEINSYLINEIDKLNLKLNYFYFKLFEIFFCKSK